MTQAGVGLVRGLPRTGVPTRWSPAPLSGVSDTVATEIRQRYECWYDTVCGSVLALFDLDRDRLDEQLVRCATGDTSSVYVPLLVGEYAMIGGGIPWHLRIVDLDPACERDIPPAIATLAVDLARLT